MTYGEEACLIRRCAGYTYRATGVIPMKIHHLIITVALLLATLFSMQTYSSSLEIVQLKNRTANEMVPLLEPMLEEDGVISGTGFQLIIRTSEHNLAELKKIIRKLDTAPRQLLISVKQLSEDEYRRQHSSARIQASKESTTIDARIYGTRSTDKEDNIQKVRVLEGNLAFIEIGQSIPIGERTIINNTIQESIRYKDVTTGFYVLPRISGNTKDGERVTLQLSPHKASLSSQGGGKINIQQSETTISGKLGEWLEISGSTRREKHKGSGFVYHTRDRDNQLVRTLVKVEKIKQ